MLTAIIFCIIIVLLFIAYQAIGQLAKLIRRLYERQEALLRAWMQFASGESGDEMSSTLQAEES